MSRSARALRTYATGMLTLVVTMVVGLVSTPWIKTWLGPTQFGAARAMMDLNALLGLFELGLAGAVGPLLVQALSRGDKHHLRQTIAAGVRTYTIIVAAILAVGLVMLVPIGRLIGVEPALVGPLRLAWGISLLSWTVLILNPYRSLLDAEQRTYRASLVILGQCLVTTALTLTLGHALRNQQASGWGMVGQAVALALPAVLASGIIAADAVRGRSHLLSAPLKEPVDAETRRALWRITRPTILYKGSGQLSLMTDNLVVSALLGAKAVGPLFLTQRLAAMTQGILQQLGVATWAAMADLHHRGERERFNQRMVELTSLLALIAFAGLGPILAYNHHFVSLWVGRESNAGDIVALVACLNSLQFSLFTLWGYALTGTGQVALLTRPAMIMAVINITASLVLTPFLGVVGPPLGTMIGFMAVYDWFLPVLLRRQFGTSVRALYAAVARMAILGIPFAALLWAQAWSRPPLFAGGPRILALAGVGIEMAASAVVFLIVGGWFGLDLGLRAEGLARIAALWARVRPRTPRPDVVEVGGPGVDPLG